MGRPKSLATIKTEEWLEKNYKEGAPRRGLAKEVKKAYPSLFDTVESARDTVRNILRRKAPSEQPVKYSNDKSFFNRIPKSEIVQEDYENFKIQGPARILVLNDMHMGAHDERAIGAALDYAAGRKKYTHVIYSDFWDGYQLSQWLKDPDSGDWEKELEMGHEMFKLIRNDVCPDAIQILKEGNHDDRLERYILKNANKLYSKLEDIREVYYKYTHYGVQYIGGRRKIEAGKLLVLHGHEVKFSGAVNPARGLALKMKVSALCGHFHRASRHPWTDGYGKRFVTYSTGCLCSLNQPYIVKGEHDWGHGFAEIELEESGDFYVQNMEIIDGKVYTIAQ